MENRFHRSAKRASTESLLVLAPSSSLSSSSTGETTPSRALQPPPRDLSKTDRLAGISHFHSEYDGRSRLVFPLSARDSFFFFCARYVTRSRCPARR